MFTNLAHDSYGLVKFRRLVLSISVLGVALLLLALLAVQRYTSQAASGAASSPVRGDQPQAAAAGILGGSNVATCDAPCWSGLTPGVSTGAQALALVEQLPGYGVTEGTEDSKQVVLYYWRSGHTEQRYQYNGIRAVDGIVEQIDLFFDDADYTLGALVDRYGPPEKVKSIRYGAESPDFAMGFLYPKLGLEFWTEFGVSLDPDRSARVAHYSYFAPITWETYLAKYGPYCGDCSDWIGFKK